MDIDIEAKDKFEENTKYLVEQICKDVESLYKNNGVKFNKNDVHVKTCEILSCLFNKADQEYNWEFSVVYDSMKELYEKSSE